MAIKSDRLFTLFLDCHFFSFREFYYLQELPATRAPNKSK